MNKFINENGLSLVEVIVGTCIMGILIVPIMGLLTANIKINAKAREQHIATSLAENEIEKLRTSSEVKDCEIISHHNGFIVYSAIETLDKDKLDKKISMHKIVVEVKRQDKIIERIETYKNSVKEVKQNE